jgi:hypothetical protein
MKYFFLVEIDADYDNQELIANRLSEKLHDDRMEYRWSYVEENEDVWAARRQYEEWSEESKE